MKNIENKYVFESKSYNINLIGLGYVGLPLAIEFGKKFMTTGYDVNKNRINDLNKQIDKTLEISKQDFCDSSFISFTHNLDDLSTHSDNNIFIITVPTPIDQFKKPDLKPLISASKAVGSILKKGDIVIYESTVYPGCTEEDCVPILELNSGLKFNADFYCGYSPERINPGDKEHTVSKILKVTSGSTPTIAEFVDQLYKSIIVAGTFKASSMKVAEAAKVIENCQRDINIAFVNELALIFNRMNIDTVEVLAAAGSKWNFLKFMPGLVGGHCIGVDPYYLTYKAESLGYHPQVILSGRRINDNMGKYIAGQFVKRLIEFEFPVKNAPILILGITFKENCPDIRNSKVIDIINELNEYHVDINCFDPYAVKKEVNVEYNIELTDSIDFRLYKGVILAVSHNYFLEENFLKQLSAFKGVIYDVKGVLDKNIITERL